MYKFVGGTAIFLIVALGVYFNWPHTNQVIAGITADRQTTAPDLQQISGFINTGPIYHLSQVKGWVVLLHFWRIGCPDCSADMGFINYLYQKYHPYGFTVLGIHSPEMDYEKDYNNIKQAVQQDGIKWPVLIDNTRATWNAYGDAFWPRDALLGKSGFERFTHIGTGDQQEIENNIRFLLAERNIPLMGAVIR